LKIYDYTPGQKIDTGCTAIALGFFDGIHVAHRRLLQKTREIAKKENLIFAVFTFPSENSFKGEDTIYSTEQKLLILEKLGVEAVILADFKSISEISAYNFVKDSLICEMNCRAAVAGYDFRFGKNAMGNSDLLSSLLSANGAICHIEEEMKIGDTKISTTMIKLLLKEGKVEESKEFLGAPFFLKSKVRHGLGLGRKLGFPTVNTDFNGAGIPLKRGVYRTAVRIGGKLYSSLTNVGTCPTFEERLMHAETFIIDFSDTVYEEEIYIFFLGFIRDEKKFNSKEELIMQINVDKIKTINENGDLTWQEIGLN
jgi:riboflavin kinase/FMN adenylyltransferase